MNGHQWSTHVHVLIWLHDVKSVLDYGCGPGTLREWVIIAKRCQDFREYDAAVKGKDALPEPAELVVATDVLEHVDPDALPTVLRHLRALTLRLLFVSVRLVRDREWWRAAFAKAGFRVAQEFPETHFVAVLA